MENGDRAYEKLVASAARLYALEYKKAQANGTLPSIDKGLGRTRFSSRTKLVFDKYGRNNPKRDLSSVARVSDSMIVNHFYIWPRVAVQVIKKHNDPHVTSKSAGGKSYPLLRDRGHCRVFERKVFHKASSGLISEYRNFSCDMALDSLVLTFL